MASRGDNRRTLAAQGREPVRDGELARRDVHRFLLRLGRVHLTGDGEDDGTCRATRGGVYKVQMRPRDHGHKQSAGNCVVLDVVLIEQVEQFSVRDAWGTGEQNEYDC